MIIVQKGKGKAKPKFVGKGKEKAKPNFFEPKPKITKGNEGFCFHCHEIGHWKRMQTPIGRAKE